MSDLISRQAAIDEIARWIGYIDEDMVLRIQTGLKKVPSAQPEITDEQAILYLQTSGWMQTHDKEMYEMGLREKLADDSDSYDALLPSAQPERKTGKWINAYPDIEPNPMLMYGICSVCGFEQSISDKLKYCPNCGARMEE